MKVSSKPVRTIGLILEDAFTDFAADIIHSVSFAVRDMKGIRLVVIPGRQDDSRDPYDRMHQYKIRHNQIYMMNEQYRFDGLLLTFPNLTRMPKDIYQGIPKVYLATDLKNEVTVNYDDEIGIREAIDYLVKIKGVTRLCMLGGRDDNTDAQKRKAIFRQSLEDNGLIFTEDQYEPGDMSIWTQRPAERLMERNPDTQAVFCVNDATASGLYDVLRRKGLEPGKEAREMLSSDNSFIDRFFDDCFYRYRNEVISPGAINLKRLFHEILARMLKSMRNRIMTEEEFAEICRMTGILFDNGVMLYTDPNRFVYDFNRLQGTMNENLKASNAIAQNNRLFSMMKDRAIQFHGVQKRINNARYSNGRNRIQDFMTWATNYGKPGEEAMEYLIGQMDRIGLGNGAMYLYREPIVCPDEGLVALPDTMQLRCVIRNDELFKIPAERRECPVSEIYNRDELPDAALGYVCYPLFCGKYLFGMTVVASDLKLFEIGEFLTFQLSRSIFMNWVTET